eukprot:gene548-biopygen460
MTTQQASRWLKERGFTAHSIKRGALQAAVGHVTRLGMDPHTVSRMGKHATPTDLMKSTVRYLGPTTARIGPLGQLIAEM